MTFSNLAFPNYVQVLKVIKKCTIYFPLHTLDTHYPIHIISYFQKFEINIISLKLHQLCNILLLYIAILLYYYDVSLYKIEKNY